jgi:hypothetical protein
VRGIAVTCFAVMTFFACSDYSDVSGLWQTPADDNTVTVNQLGTPFEGRIQLAIDQFGPDVAGIVQFFSDADYYVEEGCFYVENAKVKGKQFLFTIQLDDTRILHGTLKAAKRDGAEYLEGSLSDPHDETFPTLELSLKNVGNASDVHKQGLDEGCQEP